MCCLLHTFQFFLADSYIKNFYSPHKDEKFVSKELNKLAEELKKDKDNCYVGWSSEGVIAMMSKKRFCTKYTYAAYIAPSEELNFLSAIKKEFPKEIVFNSPQWSMTIEEISIKVRLPMVNQYIEQAYQAKRLVGNYEIVSR